MAARNLEFHVRFIKYTGTRHASRTDGLSFTIGTHGTHKGRRVISLLPPPFAVSLMNSSDLSTRAIQRSSSQRAFRFHDREKDSSTKRFDRQITFGDLF